MSTQHIPGTTLTPDRLDLPPPPVIDLGDMDRDVGWVDGDVVGFRGFADESEASHAAWVAHRTIARGIARTTGGRRTPIGTERLAIARRGDEEFVLAGGLPIATLVRPAPASRSGADTFGFEVRVPPPAHEARMREMACLVYRTLRKSGIRWTMWGRDGKNTARVEREGRRQAHADRDARRRATERRRARATDVARRDLEWGLGLTGLGLLALAFVVPTAVVPPLAAIGVGALVLAGVHELPRRWWTRGGRDFTFRGTGRETHRTGAEAEGREPVVAS